MQTTTYQHHTFTDRVGLSWALVHVHTGARTRILRRPRPSASHVLSLSTPGLTLPLPTGASPRAAHEAVTAWHFGL
jgi:hypothetical protein